MILIRTYSELITIPTYEERLRYLSLRGRVGEETFGFDRHFNQDYYRNPEWKSIRDYVIVRDLGRDLGCEGYDVVTKVIIHHMNPVTKEDLLNKGLAGVSDPEYLITTCMESHNAIHYGVETFLRRASFAQRTKNDTAPWLQSAT